MKLKKLTREEQNEQVNKAVAAIDAGKIVLLTGEISDEDMDFISHYAKLRNSCERLKLWKERRKNRRWV